MQPVKNFLRFLYTFWGLFIFIAFVATSYPLALVAYWIYGKRSFFKLFPWYQAWSNAWIFLMGMKLKVEGLEYFKQRKDYIVVGNHSSSLDIFAMASGIPIPFKAMAKKELSNIPVMGFLFKVGCVNVDRNDAESRKKSVEQVKRELQQGFSILIMPEGTRNTGPNPLGPFKEGAFRIAIEMQVPLLPVVLFNVRTLMPHPTLLIQGPGTIHVKFLEPISVLGLTEADVPILKQRVYAQLEQELLTNDPYFKQP
ncbi:MAG: 1-acyl-sn-glycerol-3-phosphate acyltransferase [Bacteroidia bacterium]|nr:1-acyl-sn-glycerol-3-phosphate acyltransferase [Bacteroidia bacterium]